MARSRTRSDISNPIRTTNGYVLIQVLKLGDPDETQWEEKRRELEAEIRYRQEADALGRGMQELEAKLEINLEAMKALFPKKYESIPELSS